MKTRVIFSTVLCSSLALSGSILFSQTCTQCDNTGDPPGTYASEIGQGTTAEGDYSFAGGINSSALGGVSFAFGSSALANSSYAISLGALTTASNSNTFALGSFCSATGTSSFVLGNGPSSQYKLENTIAYSMMIGFNSDLPTLFIGNSGGSGHTGRVGIGNITQPEAKLHIKADEGEQATLFVEPFTFSGGESAKLRLGTMDYGVSAGSGKLYFNTGGNYIFNSDNANVGIGTYSPDAKLQVNGDVYIEDENSGLILKSPDGQCWKITVNNDGTINTAAVDCDNITGNKDVSPAPYNDVLIYPNPAKNEVTIKWNRHGPGFVAVRDMKGALVLQKEISASNNVIGLDELSEGYYTFSVYDVNNEIIATEKVIKR